MQNLMGNKVILRDWKADDEELFVKWLQPGQRWKELDAPYEPLIGAEQVAGLVGEFNRRVAENDWFEPRDLLIVADKASDRLLGVVSRSWESWETNWLTLGIIIYDPAVWGQGIGYEALGLWSDYLLKEMPELARLDLRTWSGNPNMMGLALKLGYREEARFRRARIYKGQYYDGLGYGVLREEWESLYPEGFAAQLGKSL
jgi:RimJ/RimL family protein N-acetyltransferase